MDLFKYEQDYYTTKEVVENVNFVLKLTGKNSIQSFDFSNWINDSLIPKQTIYSKWSKSEYLHILGFVYLKKVIGIGNNKIKDTHTLLVTILEHPKTAVFKNNLQLLKLYNG